MIKNCKISELMLIIEERADKNSTIYTDGFKSYDGSVVDDGYKQHFRIKYSNNEFAKGYITSMV